jgi:hypothetical protein
MSHLKAAFREHDIPWPPDDPEWQRKRKEVMEQAKLIVRRWTERLHGEVRARKLMDELQKATRT